MTEYYQKKLQEGLEYQDFVFEQLRYMNGMPIFLGAYTSQKYQNYTGESLSGLEIKFDGKFAETNNLFIEVAEKTNPNNKDFVPSGIMRDDNTWLYLIGDYEQAFIFAKKTLRAYCSDRNPKIRLKECKMGTSRGYLFPIDYVQGNPFLCAKHIIFRKNDVI